MTGDILRSERALRDLDELAAYIQRDSPEAAIRFLEAAEEAFRLVGAAPTLGTPFATRAPELAGTRMRTIKGFERYLIFYRPIPDGIEVVRVLHGARDIPAVFGDS